MRQRALGDGVNVQNIRPLLQILRDHGYNSVLSMECERQAGPIVEKSLARLRGTLEELGVPLETD